MDDKRNALLTVGLICAVLFILGIADLCNSDRIYSETENRVLASRPTFSWESLLSGEYGDDYEEYMSDQFVGRDKWVGIKTRADILFQKKEINGVYLGADRYLIGVNDPQEYTEQMEDSRIASLKKLVNRWDAKVMLVPTADNILTDKLPAFAPHYDEMRLLAKVKESVGEEHYIDVYSALQEHAGEPIYYRTDHHWTSLGAYYGFLAWADNMGKFPYPYNTAGMKTVSEDFQVVHLCGKDKIDNLLLNTPGYKQFEYIKAELKDIFAMADIVISRAGANAICELLALKKPNILIPLPAASSRGDQLLNAASFEAQGYSIVLNEDDITTNLLVDKVHELYFNRQNYVDAMSKSHQMDAVKTIMELINAAADKKTN